MSSTLYKNVTYNPQIPFIFSNYIREYDISKANISILRQEGVISQELYNRLLISSREIRQKEIGLMERNDSSVYKILSNGIIQAKKNLFEANDLQDYDILTIKNDAVFVVGKYLHHTKISDYIEFVLKNTYTSFMKLTERNRIELYYMHDKINNREQFDIKGLGEKGLILHRDYMSDFICYIMQLMNDGYVEEAISSFNNFYKSFLALDLNVEYYREYNPDSMFRVINSNYGLMYMPDDYAVKKNINTSRNIKVLRDIYSYISTVYFSIKK